jgi:hypothetical protein
VRSSSGSAILDGIRLDAGQMSAYIGSAFNTARKRRVKMIVIVRTSPHRAAPDTLS